MMMMMKTYFANKHPISQNVNAHQTGDAEQKIWGTAAPPALP